VVKCGIIEGKKLDRCITMSIQISRSNCGKLTITVEFDDGVIMKLDINELELVFAAMKRADEITKKHLKGVASVTRLFANELGIVNGELAVLTTCAKFHDIGKLAISAEIICKEGKLTDKEYEEIKTHTTMGYRILQAFPMKDSETVSVIALSHHENWNGSGYPLGKEGDDIDELARIIAYADVFDALVSRRSYKECMIAGDALELIRSEVGIKFDPALFSAFEATIINNYDLDACVDFI